MSEDDLKQAIYDICRLFGLMVAHFRPARREGKSGEMQWRTAVEADGKGYPDLTIAGPGGVLFRELKSAKGPPTPEQQIWLGTLTGGGADAKIWRPADLRSGLIESELRAIALRDPRSLAAAKGRPKWMK